MARRVIITSSSEGSPGSPAAEYARKGCGSLFFSVFALAGLVFLGLFVYSIFETARPYFWTKTPCTILEAYRPQEGVEKTRDARAFVVRYRYRAGAEEHTSDVFTRGMKESLTVAKIERLLARYQPGTKTECYVNPGNPREATLQRGLLWIALFAFIPLIFIAVGGFGIYSIWQKPGAAKAKPTKRKAELGKAGPLLFFCLFTVAGGLLGYFFAVRPVLTYWSARSWPATPCEVISSRVGVHSDSDGTTYSIDIVYRYVRDGREYRSAQYGIFGGSSSGRAGKEAVVKQYPAGSRTVCYVSPADPTEAYLNRNPSWVWLVGLLPVLFFIVGVSGIIRTLATLVKTSGQVTLPGVPGVPAMPVVPGAPPAGPGTAVGGGMVEMKSSASPLGKFAGAIFIALFWNGIVGIFVWFVAKSWRQGRGEILFTLFLIPFVAIGLLLLGYIGYAFLNLFNPRVRLSVNTTRIPLGGKLEIRWAFRGAVQRIQHLTLRLEGREEATYRRGTRTTTDKHVFARLNVFETADPRLIAEGQAQFTIPEDLMHSWDGGNNKIVWEFKLQGTIPSYPDVTEDFAITVAPRHG